MPSQPIMSIRMSSKQEPFEHVRCINAGTENLNFFVSNREKEAVAVVFVSVDECCQIERYEFEDAEIDFPALMVPKDVGNYFLKMLKEEEVLINIKVSPGKYYTIHRCIIGITVFKMKGTSVQQDGRWHV